MLNFLVAFFLTISGTLKAHISGTEKKISRAEPRETVKMRTYNVLCWFSNLLIILNKNSYNAQSKCLSKIFGEGGGGILHFFLIYFLRRKKR